MTREHGLPTLKMVKRIAHEGGPFPTTASELLRSTDREWLDEETVSLLRLFPRNKVFHDRKEFVERCESLELSICSGSEAVLEPVYDSKRES